MPDSLPLLRGRITLTERFVSTRQGGRRSTYPSKDAATHIEQLEQQLTSVWQTVAKRERDERDFAASHEIIAIEPEPGSDLSAESLGDARLGMRVISTDPLTGVVLVDAS